MKVVDYFCVVVDGVGDPPVHVKDSNRSSSEVSRVLELSFRGKRRRNFGYRSAKLVAVFSCVIHVWVDHGKIQV